MLKSDIMERKEKKNQLPELFLLGYKERTGIS